ncbi:MAG: hypothetical protein NTX66_02115 [Candidatus Falkowbacteria bacterium]|nr:hypothetical protein [Candidatus Falkowbacteria bacterium]
MKTKNPKGSPSIISDITKVAFPILVPMGVKFIMGLVPKGSTIDQIMEKYHEYWEKISPALTFMVLRFTDNKDIVDDILSELSAEVSKALKERFGKDGLSTGQDGTSSAGIPMEKVIVIASMLDDNDRKNFFKLLAEISDEDQRRRFSNLLLPLKEGKEILTGWSKLTKEEFLMMVESLVPLKKPRVPTEFEKNLKKFAEDTLKTAGGNLKDFKSDMENVMAKETPINRLANWFRK